MEGTLTLRCAAMLSPGVASTAISDRATVARVRNAGANRKRNFDDKCNACMVLRVQTRVPRERWKLSCNSAQVNPLTTSRTPLRHILPLERPAPSIPSDLDDDSSPVHEQKHCIEYCYVNDCKEEARIPRVSEQRREEGVVDRALDRDERAIPRYLHQRIQKAREHARRHEGDDRVEPERKEWLRPSTPPAHIHEPRARCDRHACHPGGEHDVGAGPQILPDRERPRPHQSRHHPERSRREEAVQPLEQGSWRRYPLAGDDAEDHGRRGGNARENAFGVPDPASADPHVLRSDDRPVEI